MIILVKIGSRQWVKINIVSALAEYTGKSKTEIKRLWKQGAIDIYIEDKEK